MADLCSIYFGSNSGEVFGFFAKSSFGHWLAKGAGETGLEVLQFDAVLRTFGAGDTGNHRGQIEFNAVGVVDFAFLRDTPEPLCLVVILVETHLIFAPTGRTQISGTFVIHREKAPGP